MDGHYGGGGRGTAARSVEGREEMVVRCGLPVGCDSRGVLHCHHHRGGKATIPWAVERLVGRGTGEFGSVMVEGPASALHVREAT